MAFGRRMVRALLCNGTEPPGTWLLEFTKAMLGSGELAIGQAEELAERCVAEPSATHSVFDRQGRMQPRAVVRALGRRGNLVDSSSGSNLVAIIVFFVACCAAYLMLATTLVRSALERGAGRVRGKLLIAVHGELSNRTRHVLLAFAPALQDTTVLVLGRPKASLSTLQRQWSKEVGRPVPNLVRPFSVRDGIAAIPATVSSLRDGASVAVRMPWLPGFRSQVAIIYRELLGMVSARWWLREGVSDASIVYGHTGLADTTRLELSQQSSGCRTIHAVHGVSEGANFVGRSSVAVFRCGHDARWHSSLGGYGTCVFFPMARPAFNPGAKGVLTLTNYIHPMNFWFQFDGEQAETLLLSAVNSALNAVPGCDGVREWKPHPVFADQADALRARVVSHARQIRFTPWIGGRDLSRSREFSLVLCTPSSVALDLLSLGIAPILLDWQQIDNETAVARLPFVARNQQELETVISRAISATTREAAYREAWAAIEPAVPLGLNSIIRG
jgi:hypothetical protein